ncbi:MAG: outer membrane beta-barrel protein [Hyphomonadaceae bacterium]|jgi:opacity protein-like surface antigen|nr:outer membrane beta-barrel protein [Hyphomonadaceae bacterium]
MIRSFACAIAATCVWLNAHIAPAQAQSQEEEQYARTSLYHHAQDMAKAARACDYDTWAYNKTWYDEYAKTYGLARNPPPTPYPVPCTPMGAAAPLPGASALRPYVSVLGGYAWTSSEFEVSPPFDITARSGFIEIDAGVRIPINSSIFWGARAGFLVSNLDNNVFFAPNTSDHRVTQKLSAIIEAEAGAWIKLQGKQAATISASAGLIFGEREVTSQPLTGTGTTDTGSNVGFTAAARLEVPVMPMLSLTAQYRYSLSSDRVNIPGPVQIDTETHYVGVGVTVHLNTEPVM